MKNLIYSEHTSNHSQSNYNVVNKIANGHYCTIETYTLALLVYNIACHKCLEIVSQDTQVPVAA